MHFLNFLINRRPNTDYRPRQIQDKANLFFSTGCPHFLTAIEFKQFKSHMNYKPINKKSMRGTVEVKRVGVNEERSLEFAHTLKHSFL